MKGPSPRRLWKYATGRLRLRKFLCAPGDGRLRPQIPAQALYWSLLIGQRLREWSLHGVEALVRSPARRGLAVSTRFSEDTLSYFLERLEAEPTRRAAAQLARQAKRNKAFDNTAFIGLALDGTGAGRSRRRRCPWCRPWRGADPQAKGYHHQLVMISVVGTGLSLPLDVEPYGPGDSEYAAGQRLLRRTVAHLGRAFADYVVVDGGFATAPFLHAAGELGLKVVARLKENLPELWAAAQKRFAGRPPQDCFRQGQDRIELWDAWDFDPWESLEWPTVRVIRYRQLKPNGQVIEAWWLTNFSPHRVSARTLYRLAKSRWEIENQGFNEAKNHHGLEHICHHESNSLLMQWLIMVLALSIERLYRLRYLHRGTHPVRSPMELLRCLRLALRQPTPPDTS